MPPTAEMVTDAPWANALPLASAGDDEVSARAPVGMMLMLLSSGISISGLWWAGHLVWSLFSS